MIDVVSLFVVVAVRLITTALLRTAAYTQIGTQTVPQWDEDSYRRRKV
jgi:tellurite resistance protein TehA-like permease